MRTDPSLSVSLSVVLAAALCAAGTACGDDTEVGSGGGSSTSSTTATTTTTTTATSSSSATTGTGGSGTGGAGTGGAAECQSDLLDVDDDTSVRGPYPVGARTVDVAGLTVEVWYPAAEVQSDEPPKTYDIREHLPASEVDKIADEDAPIQTCDCFDGIPLVASGGPFPVVVFVHGTAGFRTQSLEIVTHWASRGFVVVAADHPGLDLHDLLELACGQGGTPRDLDGDLDALLEAVRAPSGDLAFLDGRIDAARLAMVGHSAGGGAIEARGDDAQLLVPMAAGGTAAGEALRSTLILGAVEDQVVGFAAQEAGFDDAPTPKRLVALDPAGHLAFSSLCSIGNDAGQNIVEIGVEAGVCGVALADGLFDCSDSYMPDETAWTIIRDATSAALEETLLCQPERGAWLGDIASRYPEVGAYDEAL